MASSPTSSPYNSLGSAHSRDSSGASSGSTPVTPTFSTHSHNRFPSSSSSPATSPDSPVGVAKPALHDVVEEPAEREEEFEYGDDAECTGPTVEEPICICDTPFCTHRKQYPQSATQGSLSRQYSFAEDSFSDSDLTSAHSFKRRRSGESPTGTLRLRFGRRFPNISKKWRDQHPTTSVSSPTVRSAPSSRASSLRLSSLKTSLVNHLEPRNSVTVPVTPAKSLAEQNMLSGPAHSVPANLDIRQPVAEDPIDRRGQASTPLLPPTMMDLVERPEEQVQSPLQSPTVAVSGPLSLANTPVSTPVLLGMPTPPLSSKPSIASFGVKARASNMVPSSEIPSIAIAEETDPWALKLGHANFHIYPEPYSPRACDTAACRRLLEDWEAARVEYMRQAARTSELYGPTSQTYKLTEKKWAEIDIIWKSNHERAIANAVASGENVELHQTLAEPPPLAQMPSLNDPQNPAKFPKLDEREIYAPMVQYARVPRQPPKRSSFLRVFTDPGSLLGRSGFGLRR